MSDNLTKSLVSLIDETLAELDELKKSDRFSASEISMGESESKMHGMPKNGSLGKEEDCDDEEARKAEGKNSEADPDAGHHQPVAKEEVMPEGMMAKEEYKKQHEEDEEKKKEEIKKEEEAHKMDHGEMKKSVEQAETLMKSYVDARLNPIEEKINGLFGLVKELADTPVPAKSVSYKNVTPLNKSEDEVQPLSKSQVANKLFELKKSGTTVDSSDIARAETGGPADLQQISSKYDLR
jgi:hypothetical protein